MQPPLLPLEYRDLAVLHGSVVLVTSAEDLRSPASGMRGWLEVDEREVAGRPRARVVIEFPQMFTASAHRRTIALTEEQLSQLLASERNGTFALKLAEQLDPRALPGSE